MAIRDDFEVVAGQVRSAAQRFALGLLIIAAFGIMLVGKADTVLVEHARVVALDLAKDRWRTIHSTFGVSHLVSAGDVPLAVCESVVDEIRAREGDNGFVKLGLPAAGGGLRSQFNRAQLVSNRGSALNGRSRDS